MKILYDYQIFLIQKYGGITKYFCEFIKQLPEGFEHEVGLRFSANAHLRENKQFFGIKNFELPQKNFPRKYFFLNQIEKINQRYSVNKIKESGFDLFHPTFYNPYFLEHLKKPFVLTIHDLIEFKFKTINGPESPIRANMEKLIKKADRLIAISENTKKDIIDIFAINENKIDVIYHGYNAPSGKDHQNKYGKYLLFVGSRISYKNFNFFLKAISPLLKRENDLKVICVGKDFEKDESEYIASFRLTGQVKAMHVKEYELNQLYANAVAFIFPSLYEGFGMPILEAFANDCPVCLSNTSSFPEVAGNAGVYFNPESEDEILKAVEAIVYDSQYRYNMIENGRKRLQNFSWSKTGMETAMCYKRTV